MNSRRVTENPLSLFLRDQQEPCRSPRCGLCGGLEGFLARVTLMFPGSLAAYWLRTMTGWDVTPLKDDWGSVPLLLEALPDETRQQIIGDWVSRVAEDSDLAVALLQWCLADGHLDDTGALAALHGAEQELLNSRDLRNLVRHSGYQRLVPKAVAAAIRRDAADERRKEGRDCEA